jgi:hypothetical protein
MQRPNSKALNSGNLWDWALTKCDSSNLLNALLILDFKSLGASFAILRAFYSTDSGIISIKGRPGGSDETKHLKSL